MESNWYDRTQILIGNKNIDKLKLVKVVLIGLGGVGSGCGEALVRSGVGNLMIVDNDIIDITNINRQLIATHYNIGNNKIEECEKRFKAINPEINIISKKEFCLPENIDFIFNYKPDFIVDSIDTITTKIFLAKKSYQNNINIISSMGMGNRYNPFLIRYGKIEETAGSGCPVARIMRSKLKKENISLNVVYSLEKPQKIISKTEKGRHSPGSFACVPPVAGYLMAYKIIEKLINL